MDVIEIIATAFGTLVSTLLGWLIAKVYNLQSDMHRSLKIFEEKMSDLVAKEKIESIIAQRRINILDSTISDICDEKFDSRRVVEGNSRFPKLNKNLKELLGQ